MLILNLPLIGLWVRLLKIPYWILFPVILLFCIIGSYSINYSTFDIHVMLIFGIIGYLFKKFEYEPAPLILAFILTPMFEKAFRQSLLMSSGRPAIFLTRPISVSCLVIALLLLLTAVLGKKRRQALSDMADRE